MADELKQWRVDGHDVEIAYSDGAMESMRRAAIAGLQKIPKRGLEIGGVLFGKRDGARVEIHQWREIECEHAQGPGFELSENDQLRLRGFLAQAAEEPALSELQAVGWYRTRTRGAVHLSDTDMAVFDSFFGEPWQVCLVIRPFTYEPAVAGFFFREADGRVHRDGSLQSFELENKRRRVPAGFDPSQTSRRPSEPEGNAWSPTPAAPPPDPAEPPAPPLGFDAGSFQESAARRAPARRSAVPVPMPPPNPRPVAKWALIGVAALLVVLVGVFLGAPAASSHGERRATLEVRDAGGQFMVEWDRHADVVSKAAAASLEVTDGSAVHTIELTPQELKGGRLVYQRQSGEVGLTLTIRSETGETLTEYAHFVGEDPMPETAAGDDLLLDTMRQERDQLQERLAIETQQTETLQTAITAERKAFQSKR